MCVQCVDTEHAVAQIPWGDDAELLAAWEGARTGYPFIDAISVLPGVDLKKNPVNINIEAPCLPNPLPGATNPRKHCRGRVIDGQRNAERCRCGADGR